VARAVRVVWVVKKLARVIRVALVIGLAEWPGCSGGLGGRSGQCDKGGLGGRSG
jgi:hypothetical protein